MSGRANSLYPYPGSNRGWRGFRFGRSPVDGQRWLVTPVFYVTIGGRDGWLGVRFNIGPRGVWFTFDGYGPDEEIKS